MNEMTNLAPQGDELSDGKDAYQGNGLKKTAVVGSLKPLLAANMAALDEGRRLLGRLSDELYIASCRPVFQSFIGAHFRHLLEHYQCFIAACEAKEERVSICYDTRPRVAVLEQNRVTAIEILEQLSTQLCELSKLYVSDEVCTARDQEALGAVPSTLSRELLFLQAHTIHHHAMIAVMCRIHGVEVDEGFGIAIATQAYNAAQKACSESSAASNASGVSG